MDVRNRANPTTGLSRGENNSQQRARQVISVYVYTQCYERTALGLETELT